MRSTLLTLTLVLSVALSLLGQAGEGTGAVQPTVPRDVSQQDPFRTESGLSEAETISGDIDPSAASHPLGLLPNPVLRTDTRYTKEDMIWRTIDTSLLDFHRYKVTEKQRYPHLYLGIVGQNYRSLVYEDHHDIGIQPGFKAFDKYWYKPEQTKYYNTKVPFTSLYYNLGRDVENNAHVVHSQNFGPFYNAALDYRLHNVQGAYQNQKTLLHNLTANNAYFSKSHRYALLFAFTFNRSEIFENGGLVFDDILDKANSGVDRDLVPVNLSQAINTADNKSLRLKQYFFLGEKDNVQTGDSTYMDIVKRKSAISYTFSFDQWKYRYTDAQASTDIYYDNYFFDSTGTNDSTRFWTVSQHLRWENTPEEYGSEGLTDAPFRYFVGLKHSYTNYEQNNVMRTWNNLALSGGFNTNLAVPKRFHYGLSAKVEVGPLAFGDFLLSGFVRWKINELMNLRLVAENKRRSPTQRETAIRTNHFQWDNNFSAVNNLKTSLIFRCDHGDIDGEMTWHHVRNYIYMDENQELVQSPSAQNILVFTASKAFDWKHFYLSTGIMAQYISDRDRLALPQFHIKQSFHYQGGFFSNNLNANLGFDITYYTNYQADGYNPATMDFYRQSQETLKFYPVLDLYFEIFIKRVRIFFLMEHVNQGMFQQKGYFVAPDYIAQDRAFKLGVSWQFFD